MDNPYRYTDPFGLFTCAKGSDCKQVTATVNSAIKLIQKAADNLSNSAKFTNRIAGANLGKLVKFLKSDNAVVGIGTGNGNELGHTEGERGKPASITLDLAGARGKIAASPYKSNPNVEMAAVVAHEAQHGLDFYNGDGPTANFESYNNSENRAYTAQAHVDQGLRSNSAWGLWSPSWPSSKAANETANMVDQWARNTAYQDCTQTGCN